MDDPRRAREVGTGFVVKGDKRKQLALRLVFALPVLLILAAGVWLARDTGPAPATRSSGSSALALAGADVLTGEEVALADFAGKPVVITIWASWCPGCRAEARALAHFAEQHPDVGFLGINFQDSREAARGFYEEYGWDFPSIFDPDGRLALRLGLQGTPTTIFLDSEHREAARIVGETDEAGFAGGLRRATGDA